MATAARSSAATSSSPNSPNSPNSCSYASLSGRQLCHATVCCPGPSAADTETHNLQHQLTHALHATLHVLHASDAEAYITSGTPVRPLRMTLLYDSIIALHHALSKTVAPTLHSLTRARRGDIERVEDRLVCQQRLRTTSRTPSPRFSPVESDCPSSAPDDSFAAAYGDRLRAIVKTDALLAEWVGSAAEMHAVADVAMRVCRLLHRIARESGTDVADTHDCQDMRTPRGSVSPSMQHGAFVSSIPWFSLSGVLSRLLLVAELCVFTSSPLHAELMPKWLQLLSFVLVTHAVDNLDDSTDPCALLCEEKTGGGGDEEKHAGAISASSATPACVSPFLFSSSLRADGLRLATAVLLTGSPTLVRWQLQRLVRCCANQLIAPATDTRAYEEALLVLTECASSCQERCGEAPETVELVTIVTEALCTVLQRVDTPTSTRRSPAVQSTAPVSQPIMSPMPEGGLLPSPATTALPHSTSPHPSLSFGEVRPSCICASSHISSHVDAAVPHRGVETIVATTLQTATVEVQSSPVSRLVRSTTSQGTWREVTVDCDGRSLSAPRRSHNNRNNSNTYTEEDDEEEEDNVMEHGELAMRMNVPLVAPDIPVTITTSTLRLLASEDVEEVSARVESDVGRPLAGEDNRTCHNPIRHREPVSAHTILRDWHERFCATTVQSDQFVRARKLSFTSVSTPVLHARVCSAPVEAFPAFPASPPPPSATAGTPRDARDTGTVNVLATPHELGPSSSSMQNSPVLFPALGVTAAAAEEEEAAPRAVDVTSPATAALLFGAAATDRLEYVEEITGTPCSRALCGQAPFLPLAPSVSMTPSEADSAHSATRTPTYPSQLPLRLRAVRCLGAWTLASLRTSTHSYTRSAPRNVASPVCGLRRLCEGCALASVLAVLNGSSQKAERPLRAALRRWLYDTLRLVLAALPCDDGGLNDALNEDDVVPAEVALSAAQWLTDVLPLIHGTAGAAAAAANTTTTTTTTNAMPPLSHVHGAASVKQLKGTLPPLEAIDAAAQLYDVIHDALAALATLMRHVNHHVAQSMLQTTQLHPLFRHLVPRTLQCLTATSTTARSGAPTPAQRSPAAKPFHQHATQANVSAAQTEMRAPGNCAGEDVSLKAAAAQAGLFPVSTLQALAARVLIEVCHIPTQTIREPILAPHYEAILQVCMAFLKGQATRLSSTREWVRALATRTTPFRSATTGGRGGGGGGACRAEANRPQSASAPPIKTNYYSTPDEVGTLVAVMESFTVCAEDMLRVHPYNDEVRRRSGDTTMPEATSATPTMRMNYYFPCLHLISRARFLHTLLRLGSSAIVDTLTETAAREVGVEVGEVALTAIRRLFALPHFAVEDRLALIREANTSDTDESEEDAEGERPTPRGHGDMISDGDDVAPGEAIPLESNALPLLTLAAQQFRLLDLDTRAPVSVRTHVKQRLLRWVRCVFEACPERSARTHGSTNSAFPLRPAYTPPCSPQSSESTDTVSTGDTCLPLAMLKHRGFLEQLTADIDRAAVLRAKSAAAAAAAAARALPLEGHVDVCSVGGGADSNTSLSRQEATCVETVAQTALTTLLVLLRHVPNDDGTDSETLPRTFTRWTSQSEVSRCAATALPEPPLALSLRRRLIALQISVHMMRLLRCSCGYEGTRAERQDRSRDVLLELAVRVLYEWLQCVAEDGGVRDGSDAVQTQSVAPVQSLHAADAVRVTHATVGASALSRPVPQCHVFTQVSAITRCDFGGATELERQPYEESAFLFDSPPRRPSLEFATAPWTRLTHATPRGVSSQITSSPGTTHIPAQGRYGRTLRQVLPHRHTDAPTMVSVDHLLSPTQPARTTTPVRSSPPPQMESGRRARTALRTPWTRLTPDANASTPAMTTRMLPRNVIEAYLHTHEYALPHDVVEAMRYLLKAGKSKEG